MCAGEARGERTWRRERAADGSAALESMRMSGGNEKHYQEEQRTRQPEARETAKRREAEEVCERESNGERGNARGYERKEEEDHDDEEDEEEEVMVLVEEEASDAMVRAYRATEGATPCASDEDAERAKRRRRGTDYLAKGHEGPQVRSMRGGRGNGRSCPDNPLPSLFLASLDPLAAFSLAPRLARSPARSFLLPFPLRTLCLFLSFSLAPYSFTHSLSLTRSRWSPLGSRPFVPFAGTHRRSRPSAHNSRPCGHVAYPRRGAQYLGDRQCK